MADWADMDGILARAVFLPRLSTRLLAAFAGAALMLAVLGIYGVLSYSVSQRTREIGLRLALGAGRSRTVAFIVRHSMLMLAGGVAGGLVAAAMLARVMSGVLYGISPFDVPAFTIAALTLSTTGLAAALLPALRAAHLSPMIALRDQ